MKPITPHEAVVGRKASIPDVVIEAFNECITEKYNSVSKIAYVSVDDVIKAIGEKGIESKTVWDKNYLDVESIFEEAGWFVEYDQPCIGESAFDAYFTFKSKS